jgi:DNA-directed RNA polymerase subunit RPC12/RpoP
MESTHPVPKRIVVRLVALSVTLMWLQVLLIIPFVILAASINMRVSLLIDIIFTFAGVLYFCGIIYFVSALRLRCPHCGYKFLKNPKGFGPAKFVYHPSCPRGHGINPWGRQIIRCVGIGEIRCINCGEEIFA